MDFEQISRLKIDLKKKFFSAWHSIQHKRWLTKETFYAYFVFLLLMPFVLATSLYLYLSNRESCIETELVQLECKARFLTKSQKQRQRYVMLYGPTDDLYLANYVEPEKLLEEDVKLMKSLVANPEYAKYEPLRKRLDFLENGANQIAFALGEEHENDFYKEKRWHLKNQVEVSYHDAKKILSLIEGVKIDQFLPNPLRPQLFLKKFNLSIQPQEGVNNHRYIIDMEVYQRGCRENI